MNAFGGETYLGAWDWLTAACMWPGAPTCSSAGEEVKRATMRIRPNGNWYWPDSSPRFTKEVVATFVDVVVNLQPAPLPDATPGPDPAP